MSVPIISLVVGARPEVIKLAPVYTALRAREDCAVRWIATGQHHEMLLQAQHVFGITPDDDLQLMQPGQSPMDVVMKGSQMLRSLWQQDTPSMVVVQGDTATAFAGALTAFYQQIPVAHVEAGLRSYRIDEPFPEESHRRMIAAVTALHFAPTRHATQNLLREGIPQENVFTVGNTVVDALLSIPAHSASHKTEGLRKILVTAHRGENHGARLEQICNALLDIRDAVPDVDIIFPVHLNPKVQKTVYAILADQPRISLVPPMDYFDFVQVMRQATLILTDSGGIQEEAPSYRIPLLVMREQTERPEAVEAGMAKLVGTERRKLAETAIHLLTDDNAYQAMRQGESPFGDGQSGTRIAAIVMDYLKRQGKAGHGVG